MLAHSVHSDKSRWSSSGAHWFWLTIVLIGLVCLSTLALTSGTGVSSHNLPLNTRRLWVMLDSHAVDPAQPRPRVAHCFAGSARTMWMPEIHDIYKANVLDRMHDADHDLFLVTDAHRARSHDKELEFWSREYYDEAVKTFNFTRQVWLNEPHNYTSLLGFGCGYANFRICLKLIEEEEAKLGIRYQHVIRTRPDLMVLTPLTTLAELPKHETGMPPYYERVGNLPRTNLPWNTSKGWRDNAWGDPSRTRGGANDLFAVLPRSHAAIYLNMSALLMHNPDLSPHCGQWQNVCECKPKSVLQMHSIPYEPWVVDVKIRRSQRYCQQGSSNNRYNEIC